MLEYGSNHPWFRSFLSLKSIGQSQFGFVDDLLQGEASCMMMVITTFVALAAPGFSKSCFDEGGSAADNNITFGGSVVHYYVMNSKHSESDSKTIGWFVQVAKLGD